MGQLKMISVDKPHGIRAVGILIHNGAILLMRRSHNEREYYTFPGGGVEIGETIEEAVIREILEETSISVSIKRLLYHHDLIGDSDHFFYECAYLSGDLALGGEELEKTKQGDIHEPLWIPLSALPKMILYPLEVRDWILEDATSGFQHEPKVLRVHPSDLRNV
ncbi:MAG: NUDIX domain-containing protein [Ktedonobacteraceae bacterium]